MIDDDDDPPRRRAAPDPNTPMGRIEGIHRRRYARLWRVDLDLPADDDYSGGQAEFDLCLKMMWCDHVKAEGPISGPSHREIDLEEFASAWRPPSLSELIEEIIAERIAAERAARDPDPEARH